MATHMDNNCQTIRNFNRFELKYLISLKQAESLKHTLNNYMVPDTYSNEDGRYSISSLYYDSPQFHCYWEKENGVMFRRKLRIRHYETEDAMTDDTPVFVEIKQRTNQSVQKRRAMLSYKDALLLCNDRQIPDCDPQDQALVEEAAVLILQYNMIPACIVRYERRAYVGTIYDAGMRVTFDTNISFEANSLCLHELRSSLPLLSADKVVMEIKVNERIPRWLAEFVGVQNLQMIRVSKYCSSIESSWKTPRLQRRQPFSETSQEVLYPSSSIPVFWKEICLPNEKSK